MNFLYILFICMTIITISYETEGFRLPKNVFPTKYKLKVISNLEEGNFIQTSTVTIDIVAIESTNKIILHSRNLNITEVKLRTADEAAPKEINVEYELIPKYDFLQVKMSEGNSLQPKTTYKLKIDYTGEIIHGMSGYYRSSYKDEKGNTKWIGTTHFEPTNARTAFPCFDEPALRAKFTIILGHQKNLTAISNMPLESSEPMEDKGWVLDTFAETKSMPTYLVAFSIHDFKNLSAIKSNKYGDTIINIWARKQSLKQVRFAKRITPDILSFYETFFNIPYPLPKSDTLAVPDFSAGAMENWGLITFREAKLLFSQGSTTEDDKHEIVKVVAHELGHYWFGDLVTMKWWRYLWLKEGFATYLAQVVIKEIFPILKVYFIDGFVSELQAVYQVDGLVNSRPVSIPIESPHLIHEIYDAISYKKASCVIRMMELFLGKEVLQKGLTNYLNKFKYSSAEADDLWHSLTEVARPAKVLPNTHIKAIMDTWTTQPGYPLVNVFRNYKNGLATFSQQRFFENLNQTDQSCYWIPLSYTSTEEQDFQSAKPKLWLPCPKINVAHKLVNVDAKSWVIFNIRASGLYRVNYDETNWKMLINQLHSDYKKISPINRILLIDDVMELALTGHVDFKIAFELIKYIEKDNMFDTWKMALCKLKKISKILDRTPHYGLIKTYIHNLLKPVFVRISGIETRNLTKFHKLIIQNSCDNGNLDCEQEAVTKFSNFKMSGGKYHIPEEIRELVYCIGVRRGDEREWNFLWEKYLHSDVATEKNHILNALGCTPHWWLLTSYLNRLIQKGSGIRSQDAVRVFDSVITNKQGPYIARLFFYEHVKEIYDIQSPKGSYMRHFIKSIASSLRTKRECDEFDAFVQTNLQYFDMAKITIRQMLEKCQIWMNWNSDVYPKIVTILNEENKVIEEEKENQIEPKSVTRRKNYHED